MSNLLQETLEMLDESGKTAADVQWVGSQAAGWATWEQFIQVADIGYHKSFGAQQVATDLVIVGNDWWLERHEYDGSEWWEFKTVPVRPAAQLKLKALTISQAAMNGLNVSCGWETLEALNADNHLEAK